MSSPVAAIVKPAPVARRPVNSASIHARAESRLALRVMYLFSGVGTD
jgi:hypothetical protein